MINIAPTKIVFMNGSSVFRQTTSRPHRRVFASDQIGRRAIADYTEAIRLDPKDASAFNSRGIAYYDKGQSDRAIKDYDKAIELSPRYATAFTGRGAAYAGKGQYDRAIADFDEAIRLTPNYKSAIENRALRLRKRRGLQPTDVLLPRRVSLVQKILTSILVILFASSVNFFARAEDAPPDRLVIGYENEGKVEASHQACLAFVKEITLWSKAEIERGAKKVCAARKRHVDAYAALQKNYRTLMQQLSKDVRLDPAGAASNLKTMMKACIEHKMGLTTGGHNIMIDVIENDIAGKCLALGANLLREEVGEVRSLRQ